MLCQRFLARRIPLAMMSLSVEDEEQEQVLTVTMSAQNWHEAKEPRRVYLLRQRRECARAACARAPLKAYRSVARGLSGYFVRSYTNVWWNVCSALSVTVAVKTIFLGSGMVMVWS